MFISLVGVEITEWYYLVPILNYTQILMDIFSGSVDVLSFLMVVISSFVFLFQVIFHRLISVLYLCTKGL